MATIVIAQPHISYVFLIALFTFKFKDKICNFTNQVGVIVKEIRVVTYTCRYSSGPLVPNSVTYCYTD